MLLGILACACFTLAYLFRHRLVALLIPRGIPGIPAYSDPLPIVGDLPKVIRSIKANHSFRVFFDGVGRDLGPIGQASNTGESPSRFVILSDFQEIESVCSRHADFERATQTSEIFDQLIPTGQIVQMTNTMWKHHRRLIGPAMTGKYLGMTAPRANEAVQELIQLFETKVSMAEGKAWSVEGDMIAATMDIICGMAFGESWGIIRDFKQQVLKAPVATGKVGEALFDVKMPQLATSTVALLDSVPIQAASIRLHKLRNWISPTYNRHRRLVFDYIDTRLEQARNRARSLGEEAVELADNTLDMMVAREMRGDIMGDEELKDEIFLYLVAGTETSAVTLSWFVKYMTNYPEVQRKLRAHLIERLPQPVTADSLAATNVPYLEAVVQETLRLSRTAGGTSREVKRDAVVLGHVLTKGTTVVMPSSFQHEEENAPAWTAGTEISSRLPSLRSSQERKVGYWATGTGSRFIPERWLKDGLYDPNAGPSLPFGAGQRGCFGKNLALLELRLVIAHLNLAFFFAPVEDDQNSMAIYETITGHPQQSFIRPIRWS